MNKVIVLALILITVCFLWSFKTLSRVIRGIVSGPNLLS